MSREPMTPDRPTGFSIVVGGPLYQGYLRAHLLRPQIALPWRRVAVAVLIAWAPLAIISAVEGRALGGAEVPFFRHLTVHVRYLVSLPLLIIAEVIVHDRIILAVGQFTDRGLVAPQDRARFDQFIAAARRLRDSRWVEVLLVALAYTLGSWVWTRYIALRAGTWYAAGGADASLTIAGHWHVFISLPLFRFLLLRWYFRLLVWYWFMWRVSRLPLRVNALHPDRAGGLGFLNLTASSLVLLLLAHTSLVAGKLADRIWHEGATLPQYKWEIATLIALLVGAAYLPTLFFSLQVAAARRAGIRELGSVAARYVHEFRDKWIDPGPSDTTGPLLGTSDIQSLADLGGSFDVVRQMGMTPIAPRSVARLAVVIALPLFPLVLTMIPFDEVLAQILRLLV